MSVKRILILEALKDFTDKFLLSGGRKIVKGFIRQGHDVYRFDYGGAFWQVAPLRSKLLSRKWCKHKVDELLVRQLKIYNPDIVYVSFVNFVDVDTISLIRQAVPNAFLFGFDGDAWPLLHKNRVEMGVKLDMMLATNDGEWLEEYKRHGATAVFMPNPCDPDIEHHYDVSDNWKCDIMFTGQLRGVDSKYPVESIRSELLTKLSQSANARIYGSFGCPKVGGMDYLYAICGAKISLSVNADNNVRFYHSDRLSHYLSCGAFVLAKRVPDSDLLFKDGVHIKYFDTIEEFFELADWYLKHEDERLKIAHAGMEYAHKELNCEKITQYILDVIEKGSYKAPWNS
jgi:glycosyltransferase involved in cell wall biosynthesis